MRSNIALPSELIVTIQETLRPALPLVFGSKDYRDQEQLIERIDLVLKKSGIEQLFVRLSLKQYEARLAEAIITDKDRARAAQQSSRHAKRSEQVLRCNVLRSILGESFRGMSKRLAECQLFRQFCKLEELEMVRVPSKSTLQDYENWLPQEKMKQLLDALTLALGDAEKVAEMGLEEALAMEVAYVDTTCLEANIHFPVDWILMRDAVRSLIKTITTIRCHGLKKRMPEPSSFIKKINSLCIAMTAAYRKADSKKQKKNIVRLMKRLTTTVKDHAKRYRDALDQEWTKTDWTRKQADMMLRHLDNILVQLPEAIRQAHERIIGERQVASEEKILSLHEKEIHLINRGKHGAQVEFGNTLLIAEEASGYILTHELLEKQSPGDAKLLIQHCDDLKRVSNHRLSAIGGDRQFDSAATYKLLAKEKIYNGLCPKDPQELSRRMQEDEPLKKMLKRRAQSEGRIGILKNVFLQGTPKAKGYKNRAMQVAWAVLAHNLWIVARKASWKEAELAPLAA
jgi:hypothetical protein